MAKQAGLFVLFGAILVIPRIRRLRRRVWAWACVRLAAVVGGWWLMWRYAHHQGGAATMGLGLALLAFSVFVRASPLVKSVDALAQDLSALIVLNGGIFRQSPEFAPIHGAQIFVHPERITVLGPRERRLLEVPLAKVRSLAAHPISNGAAETVGTWEVEIGWVDNVSCTATFHYDGAFAEHLARVTESTLRSQWKTELRIINP
ncbi:MAG: hypothetical protein ACLQVL_35765 [Terriglobia bacterium]